MANHNPAEVANEGAQAFQGQAAQFAHASHQVGKFAVRRHGDRLHQPGAGLVALDYLVDQPNALPKCRRELKILVSVVQFRPWPPSTLWLSRQAFYNID